MIFQKFTRILLLIGVSTIGASPAGAVPEMTIGRATSTVEIDGQLDDEAWQSAACVPWFVDWITGEPVDVQTRAWVCWDEDFLTVAFECVEPNMANVVGEIKDRDGSLWEDDAVELFVQPPDRPHYYHFIVNSLGTVYDAMVRAAEFNTRATGAVHRQRDRWTAELHIPWEDLGGPPQPDSIWRINLNRNRKAAGEDLTCWATAAGSFHNSSRFGKVRFVTESPTVNRLDLGERRMGTNRLRVSGALPVGLPGLHVVLRGLGRPFDQQVEGQNGRWELESDYSLHLDGEEKVSLEVTDGQQRFYRQAVPVVERVDPFVSDVRTAVIRYQQLAQDPDMNSGLQAEFRRRAARGQKLLTEIEAVVEAALSAQRTVAPGEWAQAAEPLLHFHRDNANPVLWTHHPLAESTPTMMPPPETTPPTLRLTASVNERESASLLITQLYSASSAELRAWVSPLRAEDHELVRGGATVQLHQDHLELAEAVMIRSMSRGFIGDPIALLDGAGRITIPPGETRELWLTVDTRGVEPGLYRGSLHLAPMDPQSVFSKVSVPVELRILPITLPDEMPIRVFNWDYGWGGGSDAVLADLLEHRVNVFLVYVPEPIADGQTDFTVMDESLARVHPHGLMFLEASNSRFFKDQDWQPHFAPWLRDLVAYMTSKGLDYEDWVLHMFDEALDDRFLQAAKALKNVDPKVQVFSDMMGPPERLKQFAPYVNFWCPGSGTLHDPGVQTMRESGLPIWAYECSSGKGVSPAKNRTLPWRAWRHRLDGIAFWSYAAVYGDYWDDFDLGLPDWAKMYPGPVGRPVPSKRWEAWREGLEDYLLLQLYEDTLRSRGEPRPEEEALLREARQVADLGQAPMEFMDELMDKIVQRLLEWQGVTVTKAEGKGP